MPALKSEIDTSPSYAAPARSNKQEEPEENLLRVAVADGKQIMEFFNKHQRRLVASVKREVHKNISIEPWTVDEESVTEVLKQGQYQHVAFRQIQEWLHTVGIEAEELAGGQTAWPIHGSYAQLPSVMRVSGIRGMISAIPAWLMLARLWLIESWP
jgi:hypothetical protein